MVRIFPFVCSKVSQAIQFYDCTFTSEEYKRKAARVYLSFLYKLLHVYTFEVSFYAYFKVIFDITVGWKESGIHAKRVQGSRGQSDDGTRDSAGT